MPSSILMINFSGADCESLTNKLSLPVERGYISNAQQGNSGPFLERFPMKMYFPHPVYEFDACLVSLQNNPDLDAEYAGRLTEVYSSLSDEFLKVPVVVIFLGDYEYTNLGIFGEELTATRCTTNDRVIEFCGPYAEYPEKFLGQFGELKSQVVVPPSHYIHQHGLNWNTIYKNRAGKILGLCKYTSSPSRRFIFVLPRFRNNVLVGEKLLRRIGALGEESFTELFTPNWLENETYYPRKVHAYSERMNMLQAQFEQDLHCLQTEKETLKQEYDMLIKILSSTGDELKIAVIKVLREVFGLHVEDADEQNVGSKLNEDILIKHGSRSILAEIKGTNSQNPTDRFISQVWKHLFKAREHGITEGALILAHHISCEPRDRSNAYNGPEQEEELREIIFIDTRVLHSIAVAIIDGELTKSNATDILLQKGRVVFDS